jgi:GT2 family glycosyltransferase
MPSGNGHTRAATTSPCGVDVIVLSLDRADPTLECLANILLQEQVQVQLWIVDQGSAADCLENLRDFVSKHPNAHLDEVGFNLGVPGGRGRGIRLGCEEVMVFIDNDAEFASTTALDYIVRQFDANEQLGALGFRIENYFTGRYDRSSWAYPRQLFPRRAQRFPATRYCGAGHALRRSAYQQTRGYDENLFFYWEELDISYQLIDLGYSIMYDPTPVVRHKVSPTSRVNWANTRYYYLVRNALFLDYKHFRNRSRAVNLAAGYFAKGLYNGIGQQAVKGVLDAIRMWRRLRGNSPAPLSAAARSYIYDHDVVYRGGLLSRLRSEVLEKVNR